MITGEIDIDGMTNVGGSTSAKTSNVATAGAEGLSKVFGLLGETLDKSAEFKPVEGDSGVLNKDGELFIGVKLKKGFQEGGISPFGLRPVKTKEDSTKFNIQ